MRDPVVLMFPTRRAPRGEGEGNAPQSDGVPKTLKDAKVLIVEDDFIVAFDMQTLLEDQGTQVIGPAASVAEAFMLVKQESPHAAVLDVNLNGELVFPLAQELQARGIPYIFATAYADDDRLFPPAMSAITRLPKPVLPNVLVGHVARMLLRKV